MLQPWPSTHNPKVETKQKENEFKKINAQETFKCTPLMKYKNVKMQKGTQNSQVKI